MHRKQTDIRDYGNLVSPDGVEVLNESALPTETPELSMQDPYNPLWEYETLGTIDGYKVMEQDRGLPIESAEKLRSMMEPVLTPGSEILVLSPDDGKGLDRYNEIRRLEAAKELVITAESSQYDSARSAYIVWVKYNHVEYRLLPRFDYLRER